MAIRNITERDEHEVRSCHTELTDVALIGDLKRARRQLREARREVEYREGIVSELMAEFHRRTGEEE